MTYSFTVQNSNNHLTWQKDDYTTQEIADIKTKLKSKPLVAILYAALIPVRTNNFSNFAKDFFLPTLVNQAMRTDGTAMKIFAFIGSLILDLITLPVRIFTIIPRMISNQSPCEHPLHKYLMTQPNFDPKILENDYVYIKIKSETHYKRLEHHVNFIEMPLYDGDDEILLVD